MGTLEDILLEAGYRREDGAHWIPPRMVATEVMSIGLAKQMPRIVPIPAQRLRPLFEKAGFTCVRVEGDHFVLTKPGVPRPVVIPDWRGAPGYAPIVLRTIEEGEVRVVAKVMEVLE